MQNRFNRRLIISIVLIALVVAALVYLGIRFGPAITRTISNPDRFKQLIASYGRLGALVFLFFQVIQVLIAFIPGELTQVAGGYIYGTLLGTLLTALGILIGSAIAFYLVRLIGGPIVDRLVPPKTRSRFDFLLNNKRAEVIIFLLFLIPGLPKDILAYIAGLTHLKGPRFLLLSTVARLPGQIASAYVGANLQQRDYLPVIIVSIVACGLFIAGYLNKDRIMARLRK